MLGKRKIAGSFTEIEWARRKRACTWLKDIDKLIRWKPLEHQLKRLYPSNLGRPSHPPLAMFKALLLAQWYDLSDPELEEQLLDRRSFMEFCGIGMWDDVPDETSFVLFRQRLIERDLDKKMFDYINRQLEEGGWVLKRGTMVDASLISSAAKKPPKPKEGDAQERSDPDASWGCKRGQQPVYGYKLHVGVDQGSQIIRKLAVTPANVGDTECFDELLSGDEPAVFADKGYMKKERVRLLRLSGIYAGIMRRGYRNHPLRQSCIRKNSRFAKLRSPIEGVFGRAKRLYGYARSRYVGLRKNLLKAHMLAIAMNLTRLRALACASA